MLTTYANKYYVPLCCGGGGSRDLLDPLWLYWPAITTYNVKMDKVQDSRQT